jgi:putative addiction module component (TIGR02574 family)
MDLSQILKLSIPERILLVEAIWDSIAREKKNGKGFVLSPEQILMLEEEMEHYAKKPEEGDSWETIKKRIYKSE